MTPVDMKIEDAMEILGESADESEDEEFVQAAHIILKGLDKARKILTHAYPEKSGSFFICGETGERGDDGLPENILVCPAYGLDGFALYTKKVHYSEPGW